MEVNEEVKHTAGSLHVGEKGGAGYTVRSATNIVARVPRIEDATLYAAAPDLLEALKEGRRAIGDHFAPNDCYATGPLTGDPFRDLVECPACSFIALYDAAISKATQTPENPHG